MGESSSRYEEYAERGEAYLGQKKYDMAIQEFTEAIKRGCKDSKFYKDLGIAYYEQGSYGSAIQQLVQAIALGMHDVDIYLTLGKSYREEGKYEQSIEAFKEAVKFIPRGDEIFFSNKILNEIEISQRKTVLESKPTGLWITLTTRCNLRCIMCEVWKQSWDLPRKTVKEIAEYFPYLETLYWQGGEVFLSEHFAELFEKASACPHLKQNINTNGLLIDEKWARKFSGKNINLTFAIDGITKDTYERIRKGARFEDLVRSIELVNNGKDSSDGNSRDRMSTTMSFMIMKSNYHELENTVDFAKEHNFGLLQIYPIDGTLDLENIFIHKDRKALQYINKARYTIYKKAKEYGIGLLMKIPEDIEKQDFSYNRLVQQENSPAMCSRYPYLKSNVGDSTKQSKSNSILQKPNAEGLSIEKDREDSDSEIYKCPELKKRKGNCYLPWQHLFVSSAGEVRPSCECQKEIGNINDMSLERIWNADKMQLYRKKLLERNYRDLCIRIPREGDVHFESIKTCYAQKKYSIVLEELTDFTKHNSKHIEAKILLGRTYALKKEYALAAEKFKEVLISCPENGEIHFDLGISYKKLAEYDLAIEEFEKAANYGFDDLGANLEIVQVYYEREEFDSALERLNSLLNSYPENMFVKMKIAQIYRSQKKYDLAIEELNKLIESGFDNPRVYLELGILYRDKGKYGLSIEELNKLIESGFDNPEVHLELGRSYRCVEKWESAISEYEKAVREENENVVMHRVNRELAWLYFRVKEYNLAIEQFKRAIEQRSGDGWLNVELAKIYGYGKKEYDLAIEEFKKARDKGIDNEEIATELGKLYRENKEYALSIEEFKKVLETKSEPAFKNNILSEIELSQRKTILQSKPRILTVTLTSVCNLNCIMCEVWKQWKQPWELPAKTAKELVEYFPYLEYLTWSGGEVFLYRYFRELFEEASQYPNLRQEIVTNGLLIDRDWAEKLVQSNLTLIYSIDAFSEENYERIRRGAKFQDLIRSLNILNEYRGECNSGLLLVLNFVVMKSNLHEIEKVIDFATRHRFDEVRFAEVKFLQNQENIFLNRDKEALGYILETMPKILKRAQEKKIVLHNWFLNLDHYCNCVRDNSDMNEEEVKKEKDKDFFCYLPWREMYIEPGGDVKLQCFCNQKVGNVHKQSIDEIWNGKIMQSVRKKILQGDCTNFCDSQCTSGAIPKELLGSPWHRILK